MCREKYHCPENSSPIFDGPAWKLDECKCDHGFEMYGGACGENCAADYNVLKAELAAMKLELATAKSSLSVCLGGSDNGPVSAGILPSAIASAE